MKIKEFIIYSDGNVLLTAENEDNQIDGIFLHSSCEKITPSQYRTYKEVLALTIKSFHQKKMKVYATPVDERDEKWIRSFGFMDTGLLLDGFKLLKHPEQEHSEGEL